MNDNISKKIKFFSWVMTLFIVFYHARNISGFSIINISNVDMYLLKLYKYFSEFCGYTALTFFFFLSSFWLYYKTNNLSELSIKCFKRIKTLLVPFILWSTIVLILTIILFKNHYNFSLENIIELYFFKPIIGPFWYILALLIYMIISPIIILLKRHRGLCISFVLFLIFFFLLRKYFLISILPPIKKWWWFNNMLNYFPIYLCGSLVGLYFSDYLVTKQYLNCKYKFIGALFIVEGFLLFIFKNMNLYILISIIFLIGLWLLLEPRIFSNKVKKYYSCSFIIFALHQQIILPFINDLFNIKYINVYQLLLYKFFLLLMVIIISYVIKIFLKKILSNKLYNLLLGGR